MAVKKISATPAVSRPLSLGEVRSRGYQVSGPIEVATEHSDPESGSSKVVDDRAASTVPNTVTGTTGDETSDRADLRYVLLAYGLVILFFWFGPEIAGRFGPDIPFTLPEGAEEFALFSAFYLLAQAIERFIEPLSHLKIGSKENKKQDPGNTDSPPKNGIESSFWKFGGAKETWLAKAARAAADANQFLLAGNADEAQKSADGSAKAQATAQQVEANTSILMWAIASSLGILACASLGLHLMHTIGMQPHVRIDIGISGIAVGSGTKVLHELINRLQKSSSDNDEGDDS